ncbi:MAG: hypothetical protein ACJA1C_001767 [Crocinitomicaceae bacterium]|jgi:hypothetical protein
MNKPLSFLTIGIVSLLIFATSCSSPSKEPTENPIPPAPSKVEPFYKTADQFVKDFDKKGQLSEKTKQEAFALYNEHNWPALEALFTRPNDTINGGQPPGQGGFNNVTVKLTKGLEFDRYSGDYGFTEDSLFPILGGKFTSPVLDGVHYSFSERSLGNAKNTYDFFYDIEVLKNLPFGALDGEVIPWYGKPGLGKQTMWNIPKDTTTGYSQTWNQLAEMGYIRVTIVSSPSGKYDKYVGKVIE